MEDALKHLWKEVQMHGRTTNRKITGAKEIAQKMENGRETNKQRDKFFVLIYKSKPIKLS